MTTTPDPMLLSFVDTETLGLERDAPVAEVCIINATHHLDTNTLTLDEPYTEFVWLTPEEWARADPNSLRINKLWDRHPQLTYEQLDAQMMPLTPYSTATMLEPHLVAWKVGKLTAYRHVIGAVPNFDTERLEPFLRSRGVPMAWDYHVRDIEALIAGYLAGMASWQVAAGFDSVTYRTLAAGPWKSNVLYEALEKLTGQSICTPKGDEHTAEGDTLAVVRAYAAVHGAAMVQSVDVTGFGEPVRTSVEGSNVTESDISEVKSPDLATKAPGVASC